jgi:TM2 domain-containing membrane protein YozV
MYCSKCGVELNDGQAYCGKCGIKTGSPQYVVNAREKSSGVAAVLSFLWAGLGQLYVGKIAFGLVLLLLYPFVLVFGAIVLVFALGIFGILIFLVLWLAIWIWNVFNAYNLANEYNDFLRANGRRPW